MNIKVFRASYITKRYTLSLLYSRCSSRPAAFSVGYFIIHFGIPYSHTSTDPSHPHSSPSAAPSHSKTRTHHRSDGSTRWPITIFCLLRGLDASCQNMPPISAAVPGAHPCLFVLCRALFLRWGNRWKVEAATENFYARLLLLAMPLLVKLMGELDGIFLRSSAVFAHRLLEDLL